MGKARCRGSAAGYLELMACPPSTDLFLSCVDDHAMRRTLVRLFLLTYMSPSLVTLLPNRKDPFPLSRATQRVLPFRD